jgi:hypothetical protein
MTFKGQVPVRCKMLRDSTAYESKISNEEEVDIT